MTIRNRFEGKWLGLLPLALAASAFALTAMADEPATSPYATGGTVTRIDLGNFRASYIHVFTNADEVATFASTGKRDLSVRYLVVGAGGAGGVTEYSNTQHGGGGGGGGGVCEKSGIAFSKGAVWHIVVGKGAASYDDLAGSSSISNGIVDIETVPGGGNAGKRLSKEGFYLPTVGATGGGGCPTNGAGTVGAVGNYSSSILGVSYGPFSGGNADKRMGGGGGGAGGAGGNGGLVNNPTEMAGKPSGGAGLVSDIEGTPLTYGSGGGAGESLFWNSNTGNPYYYQGGDGGDRAGKGAKYVIDTEAGTTNYVNATEAVANSGGGGGGCGYHSRSLATGGADGIVVIRYDIVESPCAGGDMVTRILKHGETYTYIHTFTNPAAAAEFVNLSGCDIKNLRYLVVGAGGAGGYHYSNSAYGGGGGGGGGVCEKDGILFAADASWRVTVGKGAADYTETAGASSISNDVADIETVPGGGNGASGIRPIVQYGICDATSGAAGGGGMRDIANHQTTCNTGAAGTYRSATLMDTPEVGSFKGGSVGSSRAGGAGGGAGTAATDATTSTIPGVAGEGVRSDITGEMLVYGSGGGGGSGANVGTSIYFNGSAGGSRAGNGGVRNDDGTTVTPASDPAPNSGCGGGGGSGFGSSAEDHAQTGGADGIVVIRYDFNEHPRGFVLIVL